MRGAQRPGGKERVSAGADKTQSDYTLPAAVEKMPTNWQDCPPRIGVHRYVYHGETQKQGFILFVPLRFKAS